MQDLKIEKNVYRIQLNYAVYNKLQSVTDIMNMELEDVIIEEILDFAKLIIELTNSNSQIVYKPLPGDDPTQRKPDITIAKEQLGWEPKIDIVEGLTKTIEYFDKKLKEQE